MKSNSSILDSNFREFRSKKSGSYAEVWEAGGPSERLIRNHLKIAGSEPSFRQDFGKGKSSLLTHSHQHSSVPQLKKLENSQQKDMASVFRNNESTNSSLPNSNMLIQQTSVKRAFPMQKKLIHMNKRMSRV